MIALFGGLGAAFAWGTATFCAARAGRIIGAASAVAWVMLVGLMANLVLVTIGPPHGEFGAIDITWMLLAGLGNVVGLLLEYSALRLGKVGLVTPVTSTEGAIAAVLAVAAGEVLDVAVGGILVVVVLGVVLTGMASDQSTSEHRTSAFWFAVLAALSFGIGTFAMGRVSNSMPISWAVLPPRVLGVVAVTVPLAMTGRLQLSRAAVPLLVIAGLAEVLGFVSYAAGARDSIAVAAVLSSQFAAVASVGAYLFFRERLTHLQLIGAAVILAGIAVLAAVTAS